MTQTGFFALKLFFSLAHCQLEMLKHLSLYDINLVGTSITIICAISDIPRNACSPAKHSYAWLILTCDYLTDSRTDRHTPDKIIPMYRYASQAAQNLIFFILNAEHVSIYFFWCQSYGQGLFFFQKYVQSQGQCHEVRTWGFNRKVIPQGKHTGMCNNLFGWKGKAKVKFLLKVSQSRGKGHEVQMLGTNRKVLSQKMHMCNIKALSHLVQSYSQC